MRERPDDQMLIERAEQNNRELFRALARVSPEGVIEEDAELLLVASGPQLPMLSAAMLKRPPADPEAALARARAFFRGHDSGFMLTSSGAAAEAIAAAANAARMTTHDEPGMLLAPLNCAGSPVPGLRIEIARDPETLRVYNDTMTEGFGGGPWALPEIIASGSLLEAPDVTHYIGFMDGRPVATATRFTSHRIAGVINVSTIPAYRRRGIGAALTCRAALDGAAEGCIGSFLTATAMGRPVYERLGYREVISYRRWLSPRP